MTLAPLFLVILLSSVSAQTNDSSSPAANHPTPNDGVDLNKTINEVEKILDKYPELPRLDRSEILNILQNITEEDSEKLTEELTGVLDEEQKKLSDSQEQTAKENGTRAGSNRSVMVVLPFKPEDEDESLEELFTRSPIVMMEDLNQTKTVPTTMKPVVEISQQPPSGFSIIEKEDKSFNPPLRVIGYRYHSTTTTSPPSSAAVGYTNFHDPEQVTMAFTTPQEGKPSSPWNHKPAHETADEINDVIFAQDSKSGVTWQTKPFSQQFHTPDAMDNFSFEDAMFQNTPTENNKELQQPAVSDIEAMFQNKPTENKAWQQSATNVNNNEAMFQNKPTENTKEWQQPAMDVSDIEFTTTTRTTTTKIASTSTTTSTTPRIYITTKDDFWNDIDITSEKPTTTTTAKPKPKKKTKPKIRPAEKTTKKPTTEGIGDSLDDLPPHLKVALGSMGIQNGMSFSPTTEDFLAPPPIKTAEASIDPASFLFFKPLPVKKHKTISNDMQQFLASFGLLDHNRNQKSMDTTTSTSTTVDDKYLESAPEINTDFLSESMKKTLSSLGLYDNPPKKPSSVIFKPNDINTVQSDEEVKKLNMLLTTIRKLASLNDSQPVTPEFQREVLDQVKQLDNITVSYKTSEAISEEIHKIMERNKGKFKIPIIMKESDINTLPLGVNPEFFDDILLKNEVKRQQENSTTPTPDLSDIMMDDLKAAGDESSATGEQSSTTTEPANSAALEDAFGGGDTAPVDADPAESLPPPRPNGLYFLLDWNTFFEVGTEDDKRRVNIRFQPKVGSPRNFLPVTIP